MDHLKMHKQEDVEVSWKKTKEFYYTLCCCCLSQVSLRGLRMFLAVTLTQHFL